MSRRVSQVIATIFLVALCVIGAFVVVYGLEYAGVPIVSGYEIQTELTLYLGKTERVGVSGALYGGIEPNTTCGILHFTMNTQRYIGWARLYEGNTVYIGKQPYTVVSIETEKMVLHRETS